MGNSGYWLVVIFMSLYDRTFSSEYIPADQQTPAFKDYEKFLDIFPLTEDNFTASVMKNPDPWVVLFHNGVLDREWKSMAVSVRGIVWVGMIDLQQNQQLLHKIGYDAKADRPARVYKYGSQKSKQSWQSVTDATTARAKSVASIPDIILSITVDDFEDFLIDSYASRPSRFPALFLTEEKDSSAVMKALASRFKKYFNFGKMVAPSHDDLHKLGLEIFADQMPTVVVLLVKGESLQFNAVPFDKNKLGDFNYPNVLAYLFSINREFRHQLPGDNQADKRAVMEMDEIVEVESRRFDVKGLSKPGTSQTVETLSEEELESLHDEL